MVSKQDHHGGFYMMCCNPAPLLKEQRNRLAYSANYPSDMNTLTARISTISKISSLLGVENTADIKRISLTRGIAIEMKVRASGPANCANPANYPRDGLRINCIFIDVEVTRATHTEFLIPINPQSPNIIRTNINE